MGIVGFVMTSDRRAWCWHCASQQEALMLQVTFNGTPKVRPQHLCVLEQQVSLVEAEASPSRRTTKDLSRHKKNKNIILSFFSSAR